MKKIFFILAVVFLYSCEDLLVEKPKTIAVETFYNTSAEVESAIAAIYSPVKGSNTLGATYLGMHEACSDFFFGRGSYAPMSDYQGLNSTNVTRAGIIWRDFYLSIRNANLVIKNVPNAAKISDVNKSKYIAEAKFLRAWIYFYLVRNWAGVPLHTELNMDVTELPRSSAAEVYTLITSDLDFAQNNLPDNAPIAGRLSKWSAKTLLADAYFYQGMNVEASAKAVEVITSAKYALVGVTVANDFDKIFGPTVVSSTEEIFYLKYSVESSWGMVLMYHGAGTPYLGITGYFALYGTTDNPLYANWNDLDLRKSFGWYKWNIGSGANTILNKKFSDPGALIPRNDFTIYRYADLLLIYAEASCQAGGAPTADGMEKLNMVHRRAYGYNALQPSPVDFKLSDYNKESFTTLVIKERGYETQAEGKRWLDLMRTGKVKEYIKTTKGKDVPDKQLLWPIPIIEMNYNKAIDPNKDQNPGY